MPIEIPKIDDRRYQDLLDEALNRIPVHNPEWTNFNSSDPGVTLIEIFAFMTESLLYRANLIPERNRKKFLQLLGITLTAATSARGIVTFINERGEDKEIIVGQNTEVSAGEVPFRTTRGVGVLPIEGRVYFKRPIKDEDTDADIVEYYRQLYASFQGEKLEEEVDLKLYQTSILDGKSEKSVSLSEDTIDNSFWIALLTREKEKPDQIRSKIANKTLSLGIVPSLDENRLVLKPGGQEANKEDASWLLYQIPKLPDENKLPNDANQRTPEYKSLSVVADTDILREPGIVEIALPSEEELKLWENLEPLELGADDFPPTLEDTKLNERLITWIRIKASATAVNVRFSWIGINASVVSQKTHVSNEILGSGNGEPDQIFRLSRSPIVPNSVRLFVTNGEVTEEWSEIDDLLSAGSEVSTLGTIKTQSFKEQFQKKSKVFEVNAESGEIRFGNGIYGARPPLDARISVSYDFGAGIAGNVGVGAINSGAELTAGLKVSNPVRTWGGADSENVFDGERQIKSFFRHRERLVTVDDFKTIILRAPGVLIGRLEIIPTFNPDFSPNEPGDAPGVVTVMVIPKYDSRQPEAPQPDKLFLDTVCRYIDERRLITTEVFLRGPVYKGIWISVGINVLAEKSPAEVREAVKKTLLAFLAPLDVNFDLLSETDDEKTNGWRLRKTVTAKELLAVASRVSGVMFVNEVILAEGNQASGDFVTMSGLELPQVLGISVTVGDALPLSDLRGKAAATGDETGISKRQRKIVPIPIIPENC